MLKRRLGDHHTGLPRGRVSHPKSGYVLIHIDEAPVTVWLEQVRARFRLTRVKVTSEFTEHQRMIGDNPEAVQVVLGVPLGLIWSA